MKEIFVYKDLFVAKYTIKKFNQIIFPSKTLCFAGPAEFYSAWAATTCLICCTASGFAEIESMPASTSSLAILGSEPI